MLQGIIDLNQMILALDNVKVLATIDGVCRQVMIEKKNNNKPTKLCYKSRIEIKEHWLLYLTKIIQDIFAIISFSAQRQRSDSDRNSNSRGIQSLTF